MNENTRENPVYIEDPISPTYPSRIINERTPLNKIKPINYNRPLKEGEVDPRLYKVDPRISYSNYI